MKTIIVATDYSDNSDNALTYAGHFAAATNAKIILFNAYTLPVHASNAHLSGEAYDSIIANNKARLEALAYKTADKFSVEVECNVTMSPFISELDHLVLTSNAELVILGMHDNDWTDKLLGNTATAVIHIASYPVMIIPEKASFKGIKKILFAYNEASIKRNELPLLKELSSIFDAQIKVYHVSRKRELAFTGEQGTAIANDTIEMVLHEVEHSYDGVSEEDVVEGIEKGVKEFEADMLVMVPFRPHFWDGLTYKSKTRKMSLKTVVPLLVLPNPVKP